MKTLLEKIFREEKINKICDIFDEEIVRFDNGILYVFDVFNNPELKRYENKMIDKFSIIGVSNYDRSYILDSSYKSKKSREISFSKSINFDLNILTFLNRIANGRKIQDENIFISYLNYIKKNQYNLNMSTARIERLSKPVNKKIWAETILSYVKYDTLEIITKEKLQERIALPEEKYLWAENILNSDVDSDISPEHYYLVLCLLIKAFLIRMDNGNTESAIEELLDYSLNELIVYPEYELYLLSKYILKHEDVQRTFNKILVYTRNTITKLKNTAWDIYHIRLVENIMLNDLEKGNKIFQYFGTNDKGLQNVININPIKILGVIDNNRITVRKYNILDIIDETDRISEILNCYFCDNNKEIKRKKINYKDEANRLLNQLREINEV